MKLFHSLMYICNYAFLQLFTWLYNFIYVRRCPVYIVTQHLKIKLIFQLLLSFWKCLEWVLLLIYVCIKIIYSQHKCIHTYEHSEYNVIISNIAMYIISGGKISIPLLYLCVYVTLYIMYVCIIAGYVSHVRIHVCLYICVHTYHRFSFYCQNIFIFTKKLKFIIWNNFYVQ